MRYRSMWFGLAPAMSYASGKTALRLTIIAGLALVLLIITTQRSDAQSLSGLQIGDDISKTKVLGGPPSVTQQMGPFTMNKWVMLDGNELSVTSSTANGKIVFLESDFGGRQSGTVSDYPGFKFSRTSLADIRTALGNNGFAFKGGPAGMMPSGLVMSNCYQITSKSAPTVCFMTLMKKSKIETVLKSPNIASSLELLDSIVIGDMSYMEGIWGEEKMFDPSYRAINWP